MENENATSVILATDCQDMHSKLNDLRVNSSLCDVCIIDESGTSLMAHSCILATGSPVLRDMLLLKQTNAILKKSGLSVKIKGISSQTWEIILQYFYFGKLTLPVPCDYLGDIYGAAKMLRMEALQDSIMAYATQFGVELHFYDLDAINVTLAPTSDKRHAEKGIQVDCAEPPAVSAVKVSPEETETAGVLVEITDMEGAEEYDEVEDCEEYAKITNGANDSISSELDSSMITPKEEDKFQSSSMEDKIQKAVSAVIIHPENDHEVETDTKLEESHADKSKMLQLEIRTIEPDMPKKTKITQLVCPKHDCGESFNSPMEYKMFLEHLRHCVMADGCKFPVNYTSVDNGVLTFEDDEPKEGPSDMKLTATMKVGSQKRYQCDLCSTTGSHDKIANHLAVVHGKRKPFACNLCEARYGYLGSFLDHYCSAHTSVTLMCPHPQCQMIFRKKDSLRRHILMVHKREGKEIHTCSGCFKNFKYAQHARRHEKYHMDVSERPFSCVQCEKRFVTKQELERHFQVHTGEKNFSCSKCSFACSRRSNLILHERKHGLVYGEYVCTTCDRYFMSEARFRNHIAQKNHEGGHLSEFVYQDVEMDENFQPSEVTME